MPISTQEDRRRLHHHEPPQDLPRGQRKLLLFFLKFIIMVAVMAVCLFFVGFAAFVLFHLLFLSSTFSRRCNRFLHPKSAAPSTAESLPSLQALAPAVEYSATVFPSRSDCAICLDSFEEGDSCRNLPVCEHLFHTKCVDRWLLKKRTCPICRTRVGSDPAVLRSPRISVDDRWMRLSPFDFDNGTLY